MQGLGIGISKRALLEDYYYDELEHIIGEYNAIHGAQEDEAEETRVDALAFLAMGGG